jgi:hypothetical protein
VRAIDKYDDGKEMVFIAYEFVEGETLAALLGEAVGRPTAAQTARIRLTWLTPRSKLFAESSYVGIPRTLLRSFRHFPL